MTHPNQPSLEDVLDMLLVTYGEPTPQAIGDFVERYPAYCSDLIEFATDWAEEMYLPTPMALNGEQEDLVFARAQSAFQNIAFELSNVARPDAAVRTSLAELARRAGKSLSDIMAVAGLDQGLISKLNGRRIRPGTIPAPLSDTIGRFLGIPQAQVIASWSGEPKALAMSFHSRRGPVLPHQEDFDIAVAKSSLLPEQQAQLLNRD